MAKWKKLEQNTDLPIPSTAPPTKEKEAEAVPKDIRNCGRWWRRRAGTGDTNNNYLNAGWKNSRPQINRIF